MPEPLSSGAMAIVVLLAFLLGLAFHPLFQAVRSLTFVVGDLDETMLAHDLRGNVYRLVWSPRAQPCKRLGEQTRTWLDDGQASGVLVELTCVGSEIWYIRPENALVWRVQSMSDVEAVGCPLGHGGAGGGRRSHQL